MTTLLAPKTSTPLFPGKKTVVYPLLANVPTLMSAGWLIPGTTIASLAPLERARVWSSAVLDAASLPPLATTTILSYGPMSCSPHPELTTVLVVPESNMASEIASSIALASSWLDSQSTFQRSSRHAHRCADVAMGLGLASVTGRARLL